MKKKKSNELERLLDFIKLTHRFQKIQLIVRVTGEDRWENDAEHSFQLAITAWYIINSKKLELDLSKVILYCLVHDMPEVYAGDACIFTDSPKILANKQGREEKATKKLVREFPEFVSFHDCLKSYHDREDKEACFVYALDKLVPILNIMTDKGRTWKQFNTSLDQMISSKAQKVLCCGVCSILFEEIVDSLKGMQGELFNSPLTPNQIIPLPPQRNNQLQAAL